MQKNSTITFLRFMSIIELIVSLEGVIKGALTCPK
jgi:hypothetical protein